MNEEDEDDELEMADDDVVGEFENTGEPSSSLGSRGVLSLLCIYFLSILLRLLFDPLLRNIK